MSQENLLEQLLANFAKQGKSSGPYSVVEIHESPDATTVITTETPIEKTKGGGQRVAHEKSTTKSEPKK